MSRENVETLRQSLDVFDRCHRARRRLPREAVCDGCRESYVQTTATQLAEDDEARRDGERQTSASRRKPISATARFTLRQRASHGQIFGRPRVGFPPAGRVAVGQCGGLHWKRNRRQALVTPAPKYRRRRGATRRIWSAVTGTWSSCCRRSVLFRPAFRCCSLFC